MYKQYLKLIENKVITTVAIMPNIPIIGNFGGDLFYRDSIKHNDLQILQVSQDLFRGPSGDIDDNIRHSCDPNCSLHIVGNRATLYSLYNISPGSEITFDYSTSSTDSYESWSMKCDCKTNKCRNTISGYQYLDDKTKNEYKDKRMIPLFLTETIFR